MKTKDETHSAKFDKLLRGKKIDSCRYMTREEADQFVAMKDRCGDGDVVEVASALPRVVREIDVPGVDALWSDVVDEVRYSCGHGVHVAGCAGHGLGDHAAMAVEDACGQVACFAD